MSKVHGVAPVPDIHAQRCTDTFTIDKTMQNTRPCGSVAASLIAAQRIESFAAPDLIKLNPSGNSRRRAQVPRLAKQNKATLFALNSQVILITAMASCL